MRFAIKLYLILLISFCSQLTYSQSGTDIFVEYNNYKELNDAENTERILLSNGYTSTIRLNRDPNKNRHYMDRTDDGVYMVYVGPYKTIEEAKDVFQTITNKYGSFNEEVHSSRLVRLNPPLTKEERDRIDNLKIQLAKKIEDEKLREQQRINEIKNRKYSRIPAKFSVSTRGKTIIITSKDDEQFILQRVVFNKRVGVSGCDISDLLEVMSTGDTRSASLNGDCGNSLVKVDVYTNRGSASFNVN